MFKKSTGSDGVKRPGFAAGLLLLSALAAGSAQAAKSDGCAGGGFTVESLVASMEGTFAVNGKYVKFEVDSLTFGIHNYALTGAQNPDDITGGKLTPVFVSKVPNHEGLVLSGAITVDTDDEALILTRHGTGGLTMKIQAKDCVQGGLFQMEVERGDGKPTVFTHTLAGSNLAEPLTAFYFDNRNFRDREGDPVLYKAGTSQEQTLTVAPRINFGNNSSRKFVGRDSPQVAERIAPVTGTPPAGACVNTIVRRNDLPDRVPATSGTVNHCGGVSVWSVASGGRMGMVFGEDSTEVAPPATNCVTNCQGQNQVRGRAVVLGFPFPVAENDRLKPRLP